MAKGKSQPVSITSAAQSHSDELWAREKRYMITMGIRTACFLIAVGVYLSPLPVWLAWIFMGGSLVLPYIAVVMANAGVTLDPGGPDFFAGDTDVQALDPPPDDDSNGISDTSDR
jgi:hypothetical protein